VGAVGRQRRLTGSAKRSATADPAGGAGRGFTPLALLSVALLTFLALCLPTSAGAAVDDAELLTYEPAGFIHSERTASEVDGFLADLDSYGIGQALLQMPALNKNGHLKLKKKHGQIVMIPRWAERAALYNTAHGTHITVTAVLNGHPKGKRLNLEDPATRAEVVASAEHVIALGVSGVQLDFEPFPTSAGFVTLLGELDEAFARVGFAGRLSVVAPSHLATWPPAFLHQVAEQLDQIDPTFYDSEYHSAAQYSQWLEEGLAYYSANVPAGVRIIPVIPSYGASRYHDTAAENIATATSAIEAALSAGSRVNGAGIWWWWGFFYDEEGEGEYDGAADRATWLSSTLSVPFTP